MKAKNKKTVLSGIQPTGELHIGNYLGSLKNFIELQNKYQCYFFLATYHSITENHDSEKKKQQIINLAIDFLAVGLDPQKCIIFNQTDVPQCTELAWIFNTITPVTELERMTQFKDKAAQQAQNINMGLLDYPVLQAADILLYHPDFVPVGKDQEQHLELTNKIVRWFNNKYDNYFQPVEPKYTKIPKVMSLLEPEKKMSKSAGPKHYIGINDSPETILNKLKGAVTGTGKETLLPPGGQNLMTLLREFGTATELKYFQKQIKNKDVKYGELKQTLAIAIAQYFAPYRQKRQELEKKPDYIQKVLDEGAQKAEKLAQKTIKEVKTLIGVL
ncbi:MAG: tryptophan--tRNA ligase [Candidatus Buchananbacteria bacterium]|nr:tryptophan--tRNA ligase [Candidatus Buchananbacteria bacterium]